MATIGKLVNGKFKQIAGNFDVMNVPAVTAESTSPGLMSVEDKKKLDLTYTEEDIVDIDTIKNLFEKG